MARMRIIDEIQIMDRTYNLAVAPCKNCGEMHYKVARWAGYSYSLYSLPNDFDPKQFATFVDNVEDTMLINYADIMHSLRHNIDMVNDPEQGIENDGSYLSILMDYARLRASHLQKRGLLTALFSEPAIPKNKTEEDVINAFELGFSAAELRLKDVYEDAIFEGFRLQEGREVGLPAAREARIRRGRKSRKAVIRAAKELYKKTPDLLRNDSETGRRIEAQNLTNLRKSDGTYIGAEAIVKHLRQARKDDQM